jgi:hypothetical protein
MIKTEDIKKKKMENYENGNKMFTLVYILKIIKYPLFIK